MPLDTSSKRRSAVGIWHPWHGAPPSPLDTPGTLDQADRQHTARVYSGILATGAPSSRLLTATVAGLTRTTPSAVTSQRTLVSVLAGRSLTPATLPTMGRGLRAAPLATSTTPAATGLAGAAAVLPTTTLTLHVDASDTGRLFTTYQSSGSHTGTPVDGSEVTVWDDEQDGIADVALIGNTGTSPEWRSTSPLMLQPCLDFSGTDMLSSVTQTAGGAVPTSALLSPTAFTVLVAFYPESITTTAATIYQNHALLAEGGPYVGVYLTDEAGTPKIYGYNYSGGVTVVPATGFPIATGQPYVFMLRHEAGTLYASLNGGAESATVSGTTLDLSTRLWIGGGAASATPYHGRIGEMAFYNSALTGATLTQALTYFLAKWLPPLRTLTAHVTGTSTTTSSLVTTTRLLSTAVLGASTTPAATVFMPITRTLTATVRASTHTMTAQVQGIFVRLSTPVGANHGYLFPVTDTLLLSGTAHGLGTAALHIGVYDSQTPRHRLTPGTVTVHASTFDVQIILAQPQACLVVLNAGRPPAGATGNYRAAFGPTNLLSISGATHALGTPTLLGVLYDGSTPAVVLDAGTMTVDEGSATVEFTFAQAQSGTVVLCGYMGTGGTVNSAVALPGTAEPVSILQATHGLDTANLVVSVYDTQSPRHQVRPGQITVEPTTHEVILRFAQAQAGTVVLNGSEHVVGVTRLLPATLQGSSTTPAALPLALRSLVSTLAALSITPSSAQSMQRSLPGMLGGTSMTAESAVVTTALHTFTAAVGGTSTTSDSTASIVRVLTAALSTTSTTAAPLVTMAVLQTLTAMLTSTSITAVSPVITTRPLTARLVSGSQTPLALTAVQHLLGAQLTATSSVTAPSVVTTALLTFTARLAGTSATLPATTSMQRALQVQGLGISATPSSLVTTQRLLSGRLAGATITPPAVGAAGRVLLARLSSGSLTPASTVQQIRLLSARVAGTGSTPLVAGATLRPLTSQLRTTSLTPAAFSAVLRPLQSRLAAQSATRAPLVIVSGLRSLTARLQSTTSTQTVSVTQQRVWSSAVQGTTSTALIMVTTQRPLTGRLAAQSQTPPALLVNTITCQAVLRGTSTTLASVASTSRTLLAVLPGASLTAGVPLQQERLLQSAVRAHSVAPVSAGILVRRFSSLLAGQSITLPSTYALARHLQAVFLGGTSTAPLVVTTERLLVSRLQVLSENVPLLLIPNSGEMLCRAMLQATSLTRGGTVLFLPPSRIGQAGPPERIGQEEPRERVGRMPARSRTALVS